MTTHNEQRYESAVEKKSKICPVKKQDVFINHWYPLGNRGQNVYFKNISFSQDTWSLTLVSFEKVSLVHVKFEVSSSNCLKVMTMVIVLMPPVWNSGHLVVFFCHRIKFNSASTQKTTVTSGWHSLYSGEQFCEILCCSKLNVHVRIFWKVDVLIMCFYSP